MSADSPSRPSYGTSAVRLAVAIRTMERAETLDAVVAAKDKAKALGLLPKDLAALRHEFDRAKGRLR